MENDRLNIDPVSRVPNKFERRLRDIPSKKSDKNEMPEQVISKELWDQVQERINAMSKNSLMKKTILQRTKRYEKHKRNDLFSQKKRGKLEIRR